MGSSLGNSLFWIVTFMSAADSVNLSYAYVLPKLNSIIIREIINYPSKYSFILCQEGNPIPSIMLHNWEEHWGEFSIWRIGTKEVGESSSIVKLHRWWSIGHLLECICKSYKLNHLYYMFTCDILRWCIISATGVLATEQPHPSSPRTGGFEGEIVLKNNFSEFALLHCRKRKCCVPYDSCTYISFSIHINSILWNVATVTIVYSCQAMYWCDVLYQFLRMRDSCIYTAIIYIFDLPDWPVWDSSTNYSIEELKSIFLNE